MTSALHSLIYLAAKEIAKNPLHGEPDALRRQVFVAVPELQALLAQHLAMKEFVLKFSYHGVGCRAGGYAYKGDEMYPCVCGLDQLRADLRRDHE